MKCVTRLALVVLILLALPLQSVAGLVMPFCAGQTTSPQSDDIHAGHAVMHDDDHATHAVPVVPADQSLADLRDCDQCGLCHLACAGALPVTTSDLADSLRSVLRPAPQSTITQFLPDPFLRPPRGASC